MVYWSSPIRGRGGDVKAGIDLCITGLVVGGEP